MALLCFHNVYIRHRYQSYRDILGIFQFLNFVLAKRTKHALCVKEPSAKRSLQQNACSKCTELAANRQQFNVIYSLTTTQEANGE